MRIKFDANKKETQWLKIENIRVVHENIEALVCLRNIMGSRILQLLKKWFVSCLLFVYLLLNRKSAERNSR